MNFKRGEKISIKVALGVVDHVGIATGDGYVISNSKRHGRVIKQSIAEFSDGKIITSHGVPNPGFAAEAVARAYSRIGEPYSLFSNNCEHLVTWAYGEAKSSDQLTNAIFWAVLGVVVSTLAR